MTKGSIEIDLFFTPSELGEGSVKGKNVVVVDVLRAATTVAHALHSGAELVIPVANTEGVTRLASTLDRKQIVLCGEREGVRIEGYELGNSPEEYTEERVEGKTLVITTTNGTAAVARCEGAAQVALASLVNMDAVVAHVAKKRSWIILCSGSRGRFALEDALCAGAIVAGLRGEGLEIEGNDACRSAEFLYSSAGADLPDILAGTEAGRVLHQLGLQRDILFCSRLNAVPVLPLVADGRIARSGAD